MDDAALKATRQLLRQVQEHLFMSQVDLGARCETLGLVELVFHPGYTVPDLNYITPRRKTAWVAGRDLLAGLSRLRALERTPCVRFFEGLYPPLFAKALSDFNLEPQQETPVLVYKAAGIPSLGVPASSPERLPAHEDVLVAPVQDQRGAELWWELWRNGLYDVLTPGMEPLMRWREGGAHTGQQLDLMVYRHKSLAGVARVSLQPGNGSSQIVALALLQEARSIELKRVLIKAVLFHSLSQGCGLVFAPGETDDLRKLYRELGFVDVGSMVSYVQRTDLLSEGNEDGVVEQPVLAIP